MDRAVRDGILGSGWSVEGATAEGVTAERATAALPLAGVRFAPPVDLWSRGVGGRTVAQGVVALPCTLRWTRWTRWPGAHVAGRPR
ncbi:hypothetical protein GCM10027075_75300 [Streptomyces heilongjiangensis]